MMVGIGIGGLILLVGTATKSKAGRAVDIGGRRVQGMLIGISLCSVRASRAARWRAAGSLVVPPGSAGAEPRKAKKQLVWMFRGDDQSQKGRAAQGSSCHRDPSSAQPFQPRIFSSLAVGTFSSAKSSSYSLGGSSFSFLT
ncbi:hypothetical protein NL676_039556 [Syzygium grande]|nr:hypothetical protein NL676_039556 [Syzygium grande]